MSRSLNSLEGCCGALSALGAPSRPETSNSPVCPREKEKEREREEMESTGAHEHGRKVSVQVVSLRVYDNRTLEASRRETRSTRYPRTSPPQLNS